MAILDVGSHSPKIKVRHVTNTRQWGDPPSLDDLAVIAENAYAEIPENFRQLTRGVIIRIDDFPDDDTVRDMALESRFDLLGLYHGVHIGEKNSGFSPTDVDKIFLYRRPLLDYWCDTGEDLEHLVRHVLIHEIGHHFGLSDGDMDRIEDDD